MSTASTTISLVQEQSREPDALPLGRCHSTTALVKRRPSNFISFPRRHRARSASSSSSSSSCNLLGGLDLSMASAAPLLASLRVLVLSHLAELENRLTAFALSSSPSQSPSSASFSSSSTLSPSCFPSPKAECDPLLKSSYPLTSYSALDLEAMTDWFEKQEGEDTMMDEALHLIQDTLDMLRRIRAEVCSHLPDLPPDLHTLEELLNTHLPDHDMSYQSLLDELRAHLPELPELPQMHMPEFSIPVSMSKGVSDVQTKLQGVKTHIREMSSSYSLDLSQPLNYLPILSAHLRSLHQRLSSLSSQSCSDSTAEFTLPSLPSTSTLSELLDRVLSSDLVPAVLHRVDGHDSPLERAAKEMSEALKKSVDGARLVSYMDLPGEWRNNPWVNNGYRFIPLHKWPIILLSLFAIHNETLNIHTHMIPLLHTVIRFFPGLNYTDVPLDRPEAVYTAFAMLCLFASVVWHTMSGCAHRVGMELCARVDYVGIGWLISASVGTVVYYGFSCRSRVALAYLSLCLVTGILGSIFPFMSWFNDRKYKPFRVAFFLGMAFTGLAPLFHLCLLYSLSQTLQFVAPISPSFLSYIIGLVFYVSHIPERFVVLYSDRWARWTDWLGGGSHAIWHAFIVVAIYQHKWGMREMRSGVGGEGCVL